MFHNIHLKELPPEGRLFEGEFRNDLFGLTGEDAPRYIGPINFSLNVSVDDTWIVVEGSITVRFELECARCGQWFPYDLDLDDFYSQEPRDGESTLDLTAHIREDILLALPGYPRCEESNVEDRTCPASGKFAKESEFIPLSEEKTVEAPKRTDVWNVLDQLPPTGSGLEKPKS